MNLNDFTSRVKDALSRIDHFTTTVKRAEKRITAQRKLYLTAVKRGASADELLKYRKRIIYWRARKLRAEHLRHDWKGFLKLRRQQKLRWLKNHPQIPTDSSGFALYDGQPVAPWMVGLVTGPDGTKTNWLQVAKDHGWNGTVVSGVRTAAHSVELCYAMCGSSSCPGRCAGATSNHNCSPGCPEPQGAIDVTDYYTFKAIMQEVGAPLRNELPIDPVHFSYTGH